MGLMQYFKDTQAEMRHVAWPTQTQTIVYTALVVLVSIIVSLYVGFFDFLLTRGLEVLVEQRPVTPTAPLEISTTTVPTTPDLNFDIGVEGAGGTVVPIDVQATPDAPVTE
ncbi:MAG: preprotein translocase subunit SecE [Candidatus Pacebacteria bacterium]|nr:preprotein translocase subunit SecE [Candidatus Paceibacterota bacterium]